MLDKKEINTQVEELFSEYNDIHPILICISGSHAYGLNTEKSDVDVRGVYICGNDRIMSEINFNGGDKYLKQISDSKNDFTFYEVSRFLELVESNNPNILELLNTPDEFILYKHPVFDLILDKKDKFISKKAGYAFNGYASTQISKARGANKMITNEKELIKKKDMLDFCYAIDQNKTMSLKKWLKGNKYEQLFCGLAKIDHGNIQKVNTEDNEGFVGGLYALYYDHTAHACFSKYESEENKEKNKKLLKEQGKPVGYGFKGIVNDKDTEGTNEIRVSNIPKEIVNDSYELNILFNTNGWSSHRKDYKKYKNWVKNRNPERYKDNVSKGYKGFDHKNALHCIRLLMMGEEILEGKGINVYRKDDREYLLSIRNGEVDYDSLLDSADARMQRIKNLYDNCNLPDEVDVSILNEILLEIRTQFYSSLYS